MGSYGQEDAWAGLRKWTGARIALGRAGGSLRTGEWLKFSWDHAAARDAVWAELDVERAARELAEAGLGVVRVRSRVRDRAEYLRRPDLGCAVAEECRGELERVGGCDVGLMVADGLSALAAQGQGVAVAKMLAAGLRGDGFRVGPVVVARFGRVGLQDEVGNLMGARASVVLIGERPGLGTAESLGAYLVFGPRVGRTNADRNCVSNIRPGGMTVEGAVGMVRYLMGESLRRGISGVGLKDERGGLGEGGVVK